MAVSLATQLVSRYPLISEQVNKAQVQVILTELEQVLAAGIAGDVVEFGCYIGTTSLFISRILRALDSDKAFHVYDSFAGLPEKTAQDFSRAGEQFTAGELAVTKSQFITQYKKAGLPLPVIHKAWFHDLSQAAVPPQIAFAFLDGDFYQSIRCSLDLVVPNMQPGGVIVIDDYAREALPGAARAVHSFFAADKVRTDHNLGIIRL